MAKNPLPDTTAAQKQAGVAAAVSAVVNVASIWVAIPGDVANNVTTALLVYGGGMLGTDTFTRDRRRQNPQIVADVIKQREHNRRQDEIAKAEKELRRAEKREARERRRTLYHAMQGWGAVAAVVVAVAALAVTLVFNLT